MRRSRPILGLALCAGLAALPAARGAASPWSTQRVADRAVEASDPVWTDLAGLGLAGQAWTEGLAPFARLPRSAAASLPAATVAAAELPTGLWLDLTTDAPSLRLRWSTDGAGPGEEGGRLVRRGRSARGFDLYLRGEDRRWSHVLTATPEGPGPDHEALLFDGLEPRRREFRLYLPIGTPLASAALGVPEGAELAAAERAATAREGPVVFYGGPDLAGAGAPRPGRTLTAVLGRRLTRPVLNLGLEAEDLLALELGALLAEVNASVFVFDLMDETSAEVLDRELEPFLRGLREARPWASVLLVDRPAPPRARLDPVVAAEHARRQKIQRAVVDRLAAAGVAGLYHLGHEELTPTHGEWTVDGELRGDLAIERTAEVLARSLEPLVAVWDERRN